MRGRGIICEEPLGVGLQEVKELSRGLIWIIQVCYYMDRAKVLHKDNDKNG